MGLTLEMKRTLIDRANSEISVTRQCEILSLNRTSLYYEKIEPLDVRREDDEVLKTRILEIFLRHPFYGRRRVTELLHQEGYRVNQKRVRRIKKELGLNTLFPKPNLSKPNSAHKTYPYLLRGVKITRPN